MKLPSVVYILSEAKRAGFRFPLALISAVSAAVSAIILVDGAGHQGTLSRLWMASQMGIPLFIALTLRAERSGGSRSAGWWIGQLIGIALLVAYYFSLPEEIGHITYIRFVQLNVGLHLLVAILPYVGNGGAIGFWQYNKVLFLRLLSGVVFSATLFVGLSIAVLAFDQLFGVDVDEETYLRLWILVVFVFNSWYFLGGVPTDFDELDARRDYPGIIKIFAQYILAPLVAVYLSILLAYLVKILVTAEWPSGSIGILVSSVAAAGLFSLVLLHPLVEQEENRWVTTYARFFYILLLPAIFMLLMAIYKRIAQYGITENRYFLTVLTFWLAFVTLHGLFAKRKTIKIIPMSLCLVAFATSFGPWGAYNVSKSSQTRRLKGLLQTNHLLSAGVLVPSRGEVSVSDRREIREIFGYLIERNGPDAVSHWFDDSLSAHVAELDDSQGGTRWNRWELTRVIMTYMDLEYPDPSALIGSHVYQSSRKTKGEAFDITGYDFARRLEMPNDENTVFDVGGREYRIGYLDIEADFAIHSPDGTALEIPVSRLIEDLRNYADDYGSVTTAPGSLMTTQVLSDSLEAKLVVFEIHWQGEAALMQLQYLESMLLLRERR